MSVERDVWSVAGTTTLDREWYVLLAFSMLSTIEVVNVYIVMWFVEKLMAL